GYVTTSVAYGPRAVYVLSGSFSDVMGGMMRRDLIDDWLYRLHDRRRARRLAWRGRDASRWFRRRGPGDRGLRPDIQGLRAVAVVLVALNHAGVKGLSGGYVGVYVFFVVSGFLITGWLLRRSHSAGEVPFRKFYAA